MHGSLVRGGRLKSFASLGCESVTSEYRQPCVIFCGHPSLRCGDVVHFMELWASNANNLGNWWKINLLIQYFNSFFYLSSCFYRTQCQLSASSSSFSANGNESCSLSNRYQPQLYTSKEADQRLEARQPRDPREIHSSSCFSSRKTGSSHRCRC